MARPSSWLPVVVLLASVLPAAAQTTGKIAGTVRDAAGVTLVGASVAVVGTPLGAAADADGDYYVNNVPAGTYTLRFSMVGFQTKLVENVVVAVDRTTQLNVELAEEALETDEVIVEAYRTPAVQVDRTHKRQMITTDELETMPVNTMAGMLEMQAGVLREIRTVPVSSLPVFGEYATTPSDGFHFRGGREGETVYLFDGVNVTDALWGGFNIDQVGEMALNGLEVQTGTFGPQYGEGMSAVVQMSARSNVPERPALRAKGYTDSFMPRKERNDTYSGEVAVEVPLRRNLGLVGAARSYSTDGYLFGFIKPNYVDTDGQDKSQPPAEEVPMQYQDERFAFGKLIYQPFRAVKVEAGVLASETQLGQYHHYFKYNPYGTPRVGLDSRLFYGRVNHVLSNRTFYEATLARYRRGFKSRVYDSPALYAILPQRGTAEFSVVGEDWVYFDSAFDRTEGQVHLTSQVTKVHQMKAGVTGEWMQTRMRRYNPDPSLDTTGTLRFGTREDYAYRPRKFSGYLLDKMEFTDIGMVLNLGLRLDYIDPNRSYPADITEPYGVVERQPAHAYVSPRLGVSFPIAERAAFRFGYGSYYQWPDFFQLYQGANTAYPRYPAPDVLSVAGAVASDDIREEHTINYEAGVQVRLSGSLSMDVTGFYRESSNLIGIQIVEAGGEAAGTRFPVFANIDFATVKGLEVSVRRAMGEHFGGFLNYTYSRAYVTTSILFERAQDVTRTYPAAWDRPHNVSLGLFAEMPGDWGGSFFGSIGSGTPYTFTRFDPNGERAPMILTNDVLLYKGFRVAGSSWRAFVQVLNLTGRRNVWWVYADSGIAGRDANPATSDDYTDNPSMWGPGRRVQVGMQLHLGGGTPRLRRSAR